MNPTPQPDLAAERPLERTGGLHRLRARLHNIVFEADTPAGRAFDLALIAAILLSIGVVLLDSVAEYRAAWPKALPALEWFFTGLFTLEYALRLFTVRRPIRYALSFYGVVDLLAIVPTWWSLFHPGARALLVVRALRLLRIFRILKLAGFLAEAKVLQAALVASRRKITVFLGTVLTLLLITGTVMYLIEAGNPGFTSIPRAMYWAVVTLTTVGYGDITPQTEAGRAVASLVMMMGFGILAVPTGIVSVELANASRHPPSAQACPDCGVSGHDHDAVFCKRCGARI